MVLNFADRASHLRSRYRRGSSVRSQPAVALFLCHTYDTALSSCNKYPDNSCLSLLRDVPNTNTHYTTIGTKVTPRVFLMWRRVQFIALPTGQRHCPYPPRSPVPQSVTCVQRSSSAKLRTLWAYVLGSAVINCLTAEVFSRTFLDVWEVCMVRKPHMLAQTLGPSFVRGVEKDTDDRPRSHGSDVGGLICSFTRSELRAAIQTETPSVMAISRHWLQICLYKVGAENKAALTISVQNSSSTVRRTKMPYALLARTIPVIKPGVFTTTHWRKDKSMDWHQQSSQVQTSTGEVVACVFWGSEGILLVKFLDRGTTVSPQRYEQTLNKWKQRIRRVQPHRKLDQLILQHDNARPHTYLRKREATATMKYIVLPNPPYSLDLAPSYFHLFGHLKDTLRGRRFVDDDGLRHRLREELQRFNKEFYSTGIQRLTQRWKKCVDNGGFVEKCPQLCKECAHGIYKFHYNCANKIWGITFVPPCGALSE